MESLAAWFQEFLAPYGAFGILVLSALDSSFIPMPAFIDLAVMGAATLAPQNAVGYGVAAIIGSTIGVMLVYGLARSGRKLSSGSGERLAWAEGFLQRRGTLALMIAALMPAPFPFKVVIVTVGYLRQSVPSVLIGVGVGRLIRFGAEAFLAARYGRSIIEAVQSNGPLFGLALGIAIAGGGYAFYRWQASMTSKSAAT